RVVEDPLFEITERVDDDEYGDDPRFLFTLTNPYQIPPTQFYNDGHQYFANGYSIMIYAKSTLNADSHIEFSTTYADSTGMNMGRHAPVPILGLRGNICN
ncbi:unnamed protein product, partial [Didymodactylos carnosus]